MAVNTSSEFFREEAHIPPSESSSDWKDDRMGRWKKRTTQEVSYTYIGDSTEENFLINRYTSVHWHILRTSSHAHLTDLSCEFGSCHSLKNELSFKCDTFKGKIQICFVLKMLRNVYHMDCNSLLWSTIENMAISVIRLVFVNNNKRKFYGTKFFFL